MEKKYVKSFRFLLRPNIYPLSLLRFLTWKNVLYMYNVRKEKLLINNEF